MSVSASRESILAILRREPLTAVLDGVRQGLPRRTVSPLIASLFSPDDRIKWHAVSALGDVVAVLAETDREAARNVIRRLMWSLNDESGSIGWGAPEALAEIMAVQGTLAEEFVPLLVSCMDSYGCRLELPALQQGLMWGMGRLAATRPSLLRSCRAPAGLLNYLDSPDPGVRGLAARALGLLAAEAARGKLMALKDDVAEISLYDRGILKTVTVGRLAGTALAKMTEQALRPPLSP